MRTRLGGLVVIGLLVAACGGATITTDEYLDRVNSACAETSDRFDSAISEAAIEYLSPLGSEPYTDEQLLGLYTEMVKATNELEPALAGMFSGLRSLPEPDGDVSEIRQLLAEMEARFVVLSDTLAAASTDGAVARVQWDLEDPPLQVLNARATVLGVGDCTFD